MDGMEATSESSLSDGGYSLPISAAIKQHHLHESIFHLLRRNHAVISKITMQRYELYFWHCPNLSEFVRICQFFRRIKLA